MKTDSNVSIIKSLCELGRAGYHKLTVAAICKRAGASHAAFYLYFKDKNEITHQVLTEFMDEVIAQARFGDRGATAYDSIYRTIFYGSAPRRQTRDSCGASSN